MPRKDRVGRRAGTGATTTRPVRLLRTLDDAVVVTSWQGSTAVLEAAGSLPDAAVLTNAALLQVLFDRAPTIACDLSRTTGALDDEALETLLDTGGHLEHWPGTRVALVFGDRVRSAAARGLPSGGPLVVRTLAQALRRLSAGPDPRTARISVHPHPRASRVARDFVSRTCLDWQHPQVIGAAVLVTSELVTNGLAHAKTDLEISLSATDDRVLLAVRDGSDELPRVLPAGRGRGMHVIEGFSRGWGSLPGPEGGKVVWVVLDA
jgi:hypothetical protein